MQKENSTKNLKGTKNKPDTFFLIEQPQGPKGGSVFKNFKDHVALNDLEPTMKNILAQHTIV